MRTFYPLISKKLAEEKHQMSKEDIRLLVKKIDNFDKFIDQYNDEEKSRMTKIIAPTVYVYENKHDEIIIEYYFKGFLESPDKWNIGSELQEFFQINIPGAGYVGNIGKPLLPSYGRYFRIPDCEKYEIELMEKDISEIKLPQLKILPAQDGLYDPHVKHRFNYDENFYSSSLLYPNDILDVKGPFKIEGSKAVLIHIRPLQYCPSANTLIGHERIVVKVKITNKKPEFFENDICHKTCYRPELNKLFLNPQIKQFHKQSTDKSYEDSQDVPTPPPFYYRSWPKPEFLIICTENTENAAKKLSLWKNRRGIPTEYLRLDIPNLSASRLKTIIRGECSFGLPRYVLLLGDTDTLPTEEIESGYKGSNATDHYYSTTDDRPDNNYLIKLPRLALGRIPENDTDKADKIISKIIKYEKDPPDEDNYYKKLTFGAHFQDEDVEPGTERGREDLCCVKTMEDIRKILILKKNIPEDLVKRVYVSDNPRPEKYRDGSAVPEELIREFNNPGDQTKELVDRTREGNLAIAYRGHGSYVGWINPEFHIQNLEEPAEDGNPASIFFNITCNTGAFDGTQPQGKGLELECFSEKLLRMKSGGAVSVVASTRPSHSFLDDDLIKGLFDGIWGDIIAPAFPQEDEETYPITHCRIGDLLNYAKFYLPCRRSFENLGPESDETYLVDHLEVYHLLGDPTLEVRTCKPRDPTIAPNNLRIKREDNYTQVVFNLEWPDGCKITAWIGDESHPRFRKSPTSQEPVSFPNTNEQEYRICFWAPGYRFYADPELAG